MLKLFANQRKITAVLLRGCLPAIALSSLRNTHNLKESRRSVSNKSTKNESVEDHISKDYRTIVRGYYYVWSLISNQGDSVMKLVDIEHSRLPGIKCTGEFDHESNLVEIVPASTPSIAMVTLRLQFKETKYHLSVKRDDEDPDPDKEYMVVTKDSNQGIKDSERFIQWGYQGFSMFESFERRGRYLGCKRDGSLQVINVDHMPQPDPRVLFLIHAKLSHSESSYF